MFRQPAAQPRQGNRYGLLALQPTRLKIGNKMHRSAAPLVENHNKQKPTASYELPAFPDIRFPCNTHVFLQCFQASRIITRNCTACLRSVARAIPLHSDIPKGEDKCTNH